MRKIWNLVSSPRNLIIFEAAARHASFTRAAEEIGIQQPSVSSAIKHLEAGLGVALFIRGHRRIDLTNAGNRLYADVSRAFNTMEDAVLAIHQMGRDEYVTLNSSTAFSYYWMMPKLHLLRDLHPGIDLRLQNSIVEPDLDAENISLGIRLGDGNWPGYEAVRIADEIIYPVAATDVMAAAKTLGTVANLMQQRLIHLEEPIRLRPTWSQWFAHHGIVGQNFPTGLKLNDYALVLQAAVSGEGFAFGWDHIVRNLLDRGILSACEDWAWDTGRGIYLIWSKARALTPQAEQVRDWIISVSTQQIRTVAARG